MKRKPTKRYTVIVMPNRGFFNRSRFIDFEDDEKAALKCYDENKLGVRFSDEGYEVIAVLLYCDGKRIKGKYLDENDIIFYRGKEKVKYALKIYRKDREPEIIDFKRDMKGAVSAFEKTELSDNGITEVWLLRNGYLWEMKKT